MISTIVNETLISHDDKTLIEMTLAGHDACFEALMKRHLGLVRKRVDAMLANKAEAEDVMQDIQLKIWTHLSSFRSESSFRTWITRIAINEALQSIRRAKRVYVWERMDLNRLAAPIDCPERLCARQETAGAIRTAIRQLPAKFQQIVLLRELRELSVKEAAHELNANPQMVKTRLFRARVMLSKVLRQRRKNQRSDWRAEIAV